MPKLKSKEKNLKKETSKESTKKGTLKEKGKAQVVKKEKVSEKKSKNSKGAVNLKKSNEKISKNSKKVENKKGANEKFANTKKNVKSEHEVKNRKPIKKETKQVAKNNKKVEVEKASKNKEKELKKAKPVTKKQIKEFLPEYYDLPYRYNETVVKILAQTPKRLFVYWDVSDKDRQRYLDAFGEDFFNKTYPVLLIHNEEMDYTFEVPINDFANSWYLDIKDSKTKYVVQLGRKFRNVQEIRTTTPNAIYEQHIDLKNDYIFITDSNKLEAPNDHILFEKMRNYVTYRNVKNGNEFTKNISDILDKLRETYKDADIKDIYRKLYGDELPESEFILANPNSGGMPTSTFR